ncbi:MAG: hypothetical protein LBO66_00880 [Deltaproteobacteria bacterium]|jgi:hypothetical protein|nr:hypothetical protein [Deltaproteobacteria bacterium]
MLSQDEQIALGAKLIRISEEEARLGASFLESDGALYVCQSGKGGRAIIVGNDGTVLYADSSVDWRTHERAYASGRRTPLNAFE